MFKLVILLCLLVFIKLQLVAGWITQFTSWFLMLKTIAMTFARGSSESVHNAQKRTEEEMKGQSVRVCAIAPWCRRWSRYHAFTPPPERASKFAALPTLDFAEEDSQQRGSLHFTTGQFIIITITYTFVCEYSISVANFSWSKTPKNYSA